MKRMIQLFAIATVSVLTGSVTADRADAAEAGPSCLTEYYTCLNDNYDTVGTHPEEEMADAECGIEYIACLARKLRFW